MRFGLHALGIGPGARREVIAAVATAAERCGFATLWAGEHVVMVDEPQSRYPYSPDGRIAVPAAADWLDPFIVLGFACAVTERIRLATGVLLLPEHNPVVVAKRAASLDRVCEGRFTLGVGVGWSAEEFAALGVPFARRGARTDEYIEAMRTVWRDDVGSFAGEFVSFSEVRVFPKPMQDRGVPVLVGGNSDAALRRVARLGDGWYGFNLGGVDVVGERLGTLARLCREAGRGLDGLHVAVALADGEPDDVPALAELGVDELVLVQVPPEDPGAVEGWVRELALRWGVAPGPGVGMMGAAPP